jgi:tyrosine-specific transport protein
MDFKLIGSILLIVGTSIGAGMLALPIATAELGFVGSLILLVLCWMIMTAGAFLILEVNLWMPLNSNIITMARQTTGKVGQVIAWIVYLLLLYSLLCAYIAGGADLLHNLVAKMGHSLPAFVAGILFTLIFGTVVFFGMRSVDYVNRVLMFIKLGAYILLILLLTPFISVDKLLDGDLAKLTSMTAITVTFTSFGYATIVPSLRVYFGGDVKKLKLAILIGGLIPLVCYMLWDAAIMGVIPLPGAQGLIAILQSKTSTSDLVNTLNQIAGNVWITLFVKLFTSICVVTSFLGVSVCMTDFLADGFNLPNEGYSKAFIYALTFVPPLLIAIFFPNAFIKALEYAGIYCVILLVLLPAWMAWNGRYRQKIAHGYQFAGGKWPLIVLALFSLAVIIGSLI